MKRSRPSRRATFGIAAGIAAFTTTAVLALTRNGNAGSSPLPLSALSRLGKLDPSPAAGPLGPEGRATLRGRTDTQREVHRRCALLGVAPHSLGRRNHPHRIADPTDLHARRLLRHLGTATQPPARRTGPRPGHRALRRTRLHREPTPDPTPPSRPNPARGRHTARRPRAHRIPARPLNGLPRTMNRMAPVSDIAKAASSAPPHDAARAAARRQGDMVPARAAPVRPLTRRRGCVARV
jgi:hypothetical protein